MHLKTRWPDIHAGFVVLLALCLSTPARSADAQALTGTLIGTVRDAHGAVLAGARVRVGSPALLTGVATSVTSGKGQFRFPALPAGHYALDVELPGFTALRETDLDIGPGSTLERTIELSLAGLEESIVVEGTGSRIDARNTGLATRFGPTDLATIPTRRASMFDWIRMAPGVSATSPSSGTATTVSVFGSGVNENQFLIDGTNTTCPCNGVARSEPGTNFIQEVQVQSAGASVEFGNMQGAVINVITRSGSDRFESATAYYEQPSRLTSQPVRVQVPAAPGATGYERKRYRDVTSSLGGPAVRKRVWFFGAYEYLRDFDAQPGTDPTFPRKYQQDKMFGKMTWRLAPGWQLEQTVHQEFLVSPEQPTIARPFDTTLRPKATVPATTFGHLTHTVTANTLWDVRVGRFVFSQVSAPATGDRRTPNRLDLPANVNSFAPPQFSDLWLSRNTAKATLSHYRAGLFKADHQLKVGIQAERGEHHSLLVIPTGTRFVYSDGNPFQSVSSDPSNTGGVSITTSAFANDAVTFRDRLTINLGVRFDHSRAVSQDLPAVDLAGEETDRIVSGAGTMYTWNVWSPRFGATARLTGDGRTILRANFGRFYQGVLTGEIGVGHPGATAVTTRGYVAADRDYTRVVSVVNPRVNIRIDPNTRTPYTDEYGIGVDREIGRTMAVAVAFIHKRGDDYISWTDTAGVYRPGTRTLADGRSVPVAELANPPTARRFLLTNPDGYGMTYDGLVVAAEKRRSRGWQAFGSYTLSRATGLLPSSAATAAGAQASTVAPPPPPGLTFGRDPNDLTNASGRLPNDRPHVFHALASVEVPKTSVAVSASFGYFSGKPWAATTQISLPQGIQRVQLETRGSRRLSSQSLLDLRISRSVSVGASRVALFVDVLNLLNETAEEGLVTDVLATETVAQNPDFARPSAFVDPRRVLLGVTLNLGR